MTAAITYPQVLAALESVLGVSDETKVLAAMVADAYALIATPVPVWLTDAAERARLQRRRHAALAWLLTAWPQYLAALTICPVEDWRARVIVSCCQRVTPDLRPLLPCAQTPPCATCRPP